MAAQVRAARLVLGGALLLWALVAVPLALGKRTVYQRDALSVHAPWKAMAAEPLRHGSVPAFLPAWGLGQPYRGNPNALPLYPGNVLYLMLPFWTAFNLHFALHWLLALLTFRALAAALDMGPLPATLAAVTFAGSGYLLSCLTFYNLIAVAAWWPLVLYGAAVGGRRGLAVGGLACGMALLAGEPVSSVLGLVPLLLLAAERHGLRRGALLTAGIAVLGALVALPQIVAALRIVGFTFRGAHAAEAGSGTAVYSLHPLRLAELLIPLPFGSPARLGRGGWWATAVAPAPPLFFSLYVGCVGLWLASQVTRRWRWWLLGGAGLGLAWALGRSGDALAHWSHGLLRYPEKLLLWPAIALPLLAGWGLQQGIDGRSRGERRALLAAIVAVLSAAVVLLARPWLQAHLTAAVSPERAARAVHGVAGGWALDLAIAAGLLLLAAWASRSRRWVVVVLLQLTALTQLAPLAATAPADEVREPPAWAAALPPGRAFASAVFAVPPWGPVTFRSEDGPAWLSRRLERQEMAPWTGALRGLRYPLAPDVEGSQSPLQSLLLLNLPRLSSAQRVRWLRVLGVDRVALLDGTGAPGLTALPAVPHGPLGGVLFAVDSPQPPVMWPARVEAASSPVEALRRVSFGSEDPVLSVLVPEPVAHRPGGAAELLEETPERLELRVRSEGGLVVLRRAYQPLYRARADGEWLRTMPVNLVLLGVVVPPGTRQVTIEVSALPEIVAGGFAVAVALTALGMARRRGTPAGVER